jgi:hypothetical protein
MDKRKSPAGSATADEGDDYMTMTFAEEPAPTESSLQRRQRLKREGEIRGRVKSKAELAAEEEEARERALSKSLLDDAAAKKNKGFAMMAKMGFQKGSALGSKENAGAATEPIKLQKKDDRGGIGLESERKRKLEEEAEAKGIKKVKPVDPDEYRERVRREAELARLEKHVYAAQRIAERMDEEKALETTTQDGSKAALDSGKKRKISSRPLKSVNVLWRGLVRHREEADRDRRMRHDLEQSLSRLPTYEDDHDDEDDRKALGKDKTVYVTADDLDEEDPELDEFNALEPEEKLQQLIGHLRKEYYYCFWCKYTYADEEMEGCPGLTEEEHD